ncbi:ATPase family associated with various cellular activities (AAA) domain-containing protein [Sarocladium implicatum]|nr:ATPase family associated with various cellular activities (AAA) domain-containing protein [Sarocladium implicatum]
MHAPGLPVLPTAAWAARIPRAAAGLQSRHDSPTRQHPRHLHTHTARTVASRGTRSQAQCRNRTFHTSTVRLNSTTAAAASTPEGDANGNGSGKSGSGNSIFENQGDLEAHVISGGRSKLSAANSLRSRQARRRNASVLPPVHLPSSFLERNVHIYDPAAQPAVPLAIAYDAKKNSKPSGAIRGQGSDAKNKVREQYFEAAIEVLTSRLSELHDKTPQPQSESDTETLLHLQSMTRLYAALIDCTAQYMTALTDASMIPGDYHARPFWWWAVNNELLQHFHPIVPKGDFQGLVNKDWTQAQHFNLSPAQTMSDFDMYTFENLRRHLETEFDTRAPPSFDPKSSRRPISVLFTPGYSGKSLSSSIVRHLAHVQPSNVVELDAYDIGTIMGSYLGQDPVYSRGSLSFLGYRAAELNGRLPVPEASSSKGARSSDEEDFLESQFITVRGGGSQNEDLQKASQGDFDVFGKWDALKVDKLLDHILRSAEAKSSADGKGHQRTLIHLHDYVELSMTLEGSFIISRLRALVDAAWHQGRQIVLMGTSSCESPSEDYQNMVREISLQDLVVTSEFPDSTSHTRTQIERSDRFLENMANVERMFGAMESVNGRNTIKHKEALLDMVHDFPRPSRRPRGFAHFMESIMHTPLVYRFLDTIIPAPLVYRVAQVFRSKAKTITDESGPEEVKNSEMMALMESSALIPSRSAAPKPDTSRWSHPAPEPPKTKDYEDDSSDFFRSDRPEQEDPEKRLQGLNEYEKRISSGIIAQDKLHVSFEDVHAPSETISALKLLTTLTLQRPDAFSYGILKRDKINGCLLYGPPGTGKTMLAKAVARDSGANMLEVSGATINDKYVGESEKLIRAVFSLAKRLSPCVIFIDEADALLANRGMGLNRTVHRELINQFLRQWDGIVETNAFIMVATNRPFDLDDAVLRRLPRKLLMDLPTKDDRAAILNLLLEGESLEPTVSLPSLADRTPFYSGSDLKNLCVAAAMSAVEEENAAKAAFVASGGDAADYKYPAKRTLRVEHFDKGLAQIPASISEDMPSLKAIRKFDEEYGDGKKGRKKVKGMGFGILPEEDVAVKEVKVRA